MRRSAAFTVWRRHSFLMNPIITSHLTKNQGRSARRGPEIWSCPYSASGCSGLPPRSTCRRPRSALRRRARPDRQAHQAQRVSLGSPAVPKAQAIAHEPARVSRWCGGATTQPPGPDLRMQHRAGLPAPPQSQAGPRLAPRTARARRHDLAAAQRPRLPDHRRPLLTPASSQQSTRYTRMTRTGRARPRSVWHARQVSSRALSSPARLYRALWANRGRAASLSCCRWSKS